MKRQLAIFAAILLVAPVVTQAVILYDGAGANLTTDFDEWNAKQDFEGLTVVTAPTDFGASFGAAMRLTDDSTSNKPELQGDLASPLLNQYRVDFKTWNYATAGTSKAIRFRMGNVGKDLGSESRAAFSVSWQADGEITAKYGDSGSISTLSSPDLGGQSVDVSIVGNNELSGTFSYDYFGVARTLNASSYDVYINGVLFNDDAEFDGGLPYTPATADYVPASGLQRYALMGSGNSDVGSDVMFDDIVLTVIPEPATLGLLGISGAFLLALRRLRK